MSDTLLPVYGTQKSLRGKDTTNGIDEYVRMSGNGQQAWGDSSLNNTAGVTRDGELIVTETERERNVFVHYDDTISAEKWVVMIDLSDTTTWPHDQTGRVDISQIYVSVDREANATGSIVLGVIAAIDATQATVLEFHHFNFNKSDTRHISNGLNLPPSQLKLAIENGAFSRGITNGSVTTTALQSDTTVASVAGNIIPAVGDVVAHFTQATASYDVELMMFYHAEAS